MLGASILGSGILGGVGSAPAPPAYVPSVTLTYTPYEDVANVGGVAVLGTNQTVTVAGLVGGATWEWKIAGDPGYTAGTGTTFVVSGLALGAQQILVQQYDGATVQTDGPTSLPIFVVANLNTSVDIGDFPSTISWTGRSEVYTYTTVTGLTIGQSYLLKASRIGWEPYAVMAYDNGAGYVAFTVVGTDYVASFVAAGTSIVIKSYHTTDIHSPLNILMEAPRGVADAALTAPRPALTFRMGGAALMSAPAPRLSAFAHNAAGENAFAYTVPRPTLSAYGGANASNTAPRPTLSATGTVTGSARATLTAPRANLSATGTVSQTGYFNPVLHAPSARLIAWGGGAAALATPKPTLSASGASGSVGFASLTAPSGTLAGIVTAQTYARANLVAPSAGMAATLQALLAAPRARLSAAGSAVVAITYEAYAVNLMPGEGMPHQVTRYTNYPFNQVVRFRNQYFGVADDGLYEIGGLTETPWAFKTALDDFKESAMKTAIAAHFGGRLNPAATVTMYAGESGSQAYTYNTVREGDAQNYRQKLGRGVKTRYMALQLEGEGTLELDNIELEINKLSRRIYGNSK